MKAVSRLTVEGDGVLTRRGKFTDPAVIAHTGLRKIPASRLDVAKESTIRYRRECTLMRIAGTDSSGKRPGPRLFFSGRYWTAPSPWPDSTY